MSDLCVKLRNRIILLKSQDMMPEVVSELDQAADKIEQLQQRVGELEGLLRESAKTADEFYLQRQDAVNKQEALAAHNEKLLANIKQCLLFVRGQDPDYANMLDELIDQKPETGLAEVRAQPIRGAVEQCGPLRRVDWPNQQAATDDLFIFKHGGAISYEDLQDRLRCNRNLSGLMVFRIDWEALKNVPMFTF